MAKKKSKSDVVNADQIATLIRIFRSAVLSGDKSLSDAASVNLAKRGIRTADLAASGVSSEKGVTNDPS